MVVHGGLVLFPGVLYMYRANKNIMACLILDRMEETVSNRVYAGYLAGLPPPDTPDCASLHVVHIHRHEPGEECAGQ